MSLFIIFSLNASLMIAMRAGIYKNNSENNSGKTTERFGKLIEK
jgi:hypothetical protein